MKNVRLLTYLTMCGATKQREITNIYLRNLLCTNQLPSQRGDERIPSSLVTLISSLLPNPLPTPVTITLTFDRITFHALVTETLSHELTVFLRSIAMVIGPSPPGTGVILHFSPAVSCAAFTPL